MITTSQRFILEHIKLLQGATRIGRREFKTLKESKKSEKSFVDVGKDSSSTDDFADTQPKYEPVNCKQESGCQRIDESEVLWELPYSSNPEDINRIFKVNEGASLKYNAIIGFND